MECYLQPLQVVLGYTSLGVDLFACWWTGGHSKCCCVEYSSFLPFVVLVKGAK
jgi:hypothetical protein